MPHRGSPSAAAFHQKAMQNYKIFPTLPNIPLDSYILPDPSYLSGTSDASGLSCGFFLDGMVHTADTVKPNLESPP